ncbi:MAG: hypothetical protein AAB401_08620 [Acidobacteriota bacterium]
MKSPHCLICLLGAAENSLVCSGLCVYFPSFVAARAFPRVFSTHKPTGIFFAIVVAMVNEQERQSGLTTGDLPGGLI